MSCQAVKKFIHKLYNEPPHVSLGLAWQKSPDMHWSGLYRGHTGHRWSSVTECRAARVEAADMIHGAMPDVVDQQGLEIMQ